jgi:hypothetical protein
MSDNIVNLPLVFNGRRHWHHPDRSRMTECGLSFDEYQFTLDPEAKGICWNCLSVAMDRSEMKVLKQVLDAATAWAETAWAENGEDLDRQIDLHHAVTHYWDWMNYEGEE